MSKKSQRIDKLIYASNIINHPLKGFGANAEQVTYSKQAAEVVLKTIEEVLALDGVFCHKLEPSNE